MKISALWISRNLWESYEWESHDGFAHLIFLFGASTQPVSIFGALRASNVEHQKTACVDRRRLPPFLSSIAALIGGWSISQPACQTVRWESASRAVVKKRLLLLCCNNFVDLKICKYFLCLFFKASWIFDAKLFEVYCSIDAEANYGGK